MNVKQRVFTHCWSLIFIPTVYSKVEFLILLAPNQEWNELRFFLSCHDNDEGILWVWTICFSIYLNAIIITKPHGDVILP